MQQMVCGAEMPAELSTEEKAVAGLPLSYHQLRPGPGLAPRVCPQPGLTQWQSLRVDLASPQLKWETLTAWPSEQTLLHRPHGLPAGLRQGPLWPRRSQKKEMALIAEA